jgi:hypothetical protein
MRALSSNDALARIEFRHHFWRRLQSTCTRRSMHFTITIYRLSICWLCEYLSRFGTHQVYEHLQQVPKMPAVIRKDTMGSGPGHDILPWFHLRTTTQEDSVAILYQETQWNFRLLFIPTHSAGRQQGWCSIIWRVHRPLQSRCNQPQPTLQHGWPAVT